MSKIKFNNVGKRWGDFIALDDFNLEIEDNEFLVLLGPSGCGKTTTMRILAGLDIATKGDIYIDDTLVNNLEPKDRDVAMVFQNYGLYPNLSVYENIRFPLKIRKVPKSQHHDKIIAASDRVKLGKFLDRKPAALSGGQRQRVALARAIVREPRVFLMDEPLSNLDAKLRVSTRLEIKILQQQLAITTIYVTHDQIEAMTLADRVVIMNKGAINQVGTPKEIYNRPVNTFVASFIGSPAMNLIKGSIYNSRFTTKDFAIDNVIDIDSDNITLGFRAEDVEISSKEQSNFSLNLYSYELLGDCLMLSFLINDSLVAVKAHKDLAVNIGDTIYMYISPEHCHVFDTQTKNRIN